MTHDAVIHLPPDTDSGRGTFLLALCGLLVLAVKVASQTHACHDNGLATELNVLFAFDV